MIRLARPGDAPSIADIERRAGERFREVGLDQVADDPPLPLEVLARYIAAGRAWVAASSEAGQPIGYVLADIVDGNAHIEQVSVDPARQGEGIGRALVAVVTTWAGDQALGGVTLTTFAAVPWNAPWYRHLGFGELAEPEVGPELHALRALEAAHGLDPKMRVCMYLRVPQ